MLIHENTPKTNFHIENKHGIITILYAFKF